MQSFAVDWVSAIPGGDALSNLSKRRETRTKLIHTGQD